MSSELMTILLYGIPLMVLSVFLSYFSKVVDNLSTAEYKEIGTNNDSRKIYAQSDGLIIDSDSEFSCLR